MAYFDVRLEGGPADGDEGRCNELPGRIYAALCPRCADWHWYGEREGGCEVYVQAEVDRLSNFARYVYEELHVRDGLVDTERRRPYAFPAAAVARIEEAFRAATRR